jgi:hypothetical protein
VTDGPQPKIDLKLLWSKLVLPTLEHDRTPAYRTSQDATTNERVCVFDRDTYSSDTCEQLFACLA